MSGRFIENGRTVVALRSGVDPAEAKENPETGVLRAAATHSPDHTNGMLRSGIWNGDTVTQWFARWARETPSKPAFVDERRATTYAEAFRQAEGFAGALLGLGLRKGDVVAVQLPNTVEFAIAYLGITMMGGVLTTLHMPYRRNEAEPILRHAGARAVICGPRADAYAPAEMFLGLRQRLPLFRHVIVVGEKHPGTEEFGGMVVRGASAAIDNPPEAADPAFICFSSGTSASPKSVVHSYHNMLANNRQCAPMYGLTQDDVIVSGPPFTHGFGICCINLTLLVGATHAIFPPFRPDTYCQAIEGLRPTVLFTAPAHIAACWKAGLLERTDFSSLRIVGISGAPCPPPVAAAFQQVAKNGKVLVLWGMTELFMGISGRPDDPKEDRFGTIGRPTPGMEVRIAAENGQPLPPGEEGEIVIRGPSVVAGYLGNEAATNAAFRGDWFRTGDVGIVDRRGFVRMTRRLGEVINRGGVKINPVDIEALLDNHPKVQQSAIVPFADPVLGQRACAFVVLRPNESLTLEEVTRYLESHGVAKLKWPERLKIIAEMPMTPTRKIIKGLLKPTATAS
jgi:acyl-CoA synthetase (AMP-forming)/AMP-acid ligase II